MSAKKMMIQLQQAMILELQKFCNFFLFHANKNLY